MTQMFSGIRGGSEFISWDHPQAHGMIHSSAAVLGSHRSHLVVWREPWTNRRLGFRAKGSVAFSKAFYLAQPQFLYLKIGKMSSDLLPSQGF